MYSGECYKTASGNQAYNDDDEEFLLKKIDVTKPQAVIWPSTLWLAHGSQSGLKALQWKIKKLFTAKTAKLLTRAVLLRLRQKQNAPGASLTALWQTVCLL
ncbi:hypothetical protein [Phascolarctobacterium succinatutens]|uniref:hypothetical protein n=1 Tax=Phascolarctobacterium succinatutens TaxID=626940 RepID=UPI003F65F329